MKKIISLLLTALVCLPLLVFALNAATPYGTVIGSGHVDAAPDMKAGLPDGSWGKKVITVNGKSDNAGITQYKPDTKRFGTVKQDLSIDVYTVWTDTALYICVTSPDPDIVGAGPNWWWGDGVQIIIVPGIEDVSYCNVMFGDRDTYRLSEWGCCFMADGFTEDPSDTAMDHCSIYGDMTAGMISVKFEMPFTDLGYKKGEVPADGSYFSFVLCRVDGDEEDRAEAYHGWLEWGDLFNADKGWDKNDTVLYVPTAENPKTKTANTIRLEKGASAPAGQPKQEEPVTPPVNPSSELPSSWAAEEVDAAIAEGLVPADLRKDYTKGISRENLSKMLGVLIDKVYGKAPTATDAKFTDTTDAAVLKAANLGIINGYRQADGTYMFKPANTLKRSEMSAIINRVAKLCGKTTTGYDKEVKFTDTASHWCKGELGYPVHMGIVKGTSATTFSPENTLTTEQTIMMIYRTFRAIK